MILFTLQVQYRLIRFMFSSLNNRSVVSNDTVSNKDNLSK